MVLIEVGTLPYAAYSHLFLCVTHLQRSLSCFTRNTLIEVAIYFWVIPTYQPTSVVGNTVLSAYYGIDNHNVFKFYAYTHRMDQLHSVFLHLMAGYLS